MSKGLVRSLSRGPKAQAPIVRQTFTLKDVAIEVDGATGVGFGTVVVGDFPEGNVLFQGCVAYLQFFSADAGVTTTYDGDYALGTTATTDATVTGTDADLTALAALGAATAKLSPVARAAGSTQAMFDNTDGSLEINLNLIIDDASISADDVEMTVSGDIHIVYMVLGDD
jgi:hypothetical protein